MKPLRFIEMKYRVPALLLLLVNLGFVGCQSRPAPELHYYLLQPSTSELSRGIVEVSRVDLPAYLQSTSVMLAVSDYEIRPAQYHLWAEPLEDGIRRVLEAELVAQLKYVDREVIPISVELDLEVFHATDSGQVLLKGAWRLESEEAEGHSFSITTGLKEDGYPAAVESHVRALLLLAKAIAGDL